MDLPVPAGATVRELFESCLVFSSQLGELNSIMKVAEACYDNAFGAHLDVIDP
jgi:hypothetical protein